MSDSRDGADYALDRAGRAFMIGRWAEALEAYEEAISLDDKSAETRAQAGRCRLRLGRGSEAADDFEAAIAVAENPEVSWLVELGDAYLQDGDEDRAAANFQAALERDPNRAEAFAGMGLLYIRNRAYQMARTALERAVELGPLETSLAGVRNNLAIVYCYFGDFERAADELDAAGNLGFPVDPSFREKLAKEIIGQRQAHQEEPS
ncbi:MAG: tetratricopeptide repeat protein [bacterium]|nr:tetratricopeptide repeat protein [bacterium]